MLSLSPLGIDLRSLLTRPGLLHCASKRLESSCCDLNSFGNLDPGLATRPHCYLSLTVARSWAPELRDEMTRQIKGTIQGQGQGQNRILTRVILLC